MHPPKQNTIKLVNTISGDTDPQVYCQSGGLQTSNLLRNRFKIKEKRLSHMPSFIFIQNAHATYITKTSAYTRPRGGIIITFQAVVRIITICVIFLVTALFSVPGTP